MPLGVMAAALGAVALGAMLAGCVRRASSHREITSVGEIRALREAAAGVPVRLKGNVTYNDGRLNLLFLEDGSGGVRIENSFVANTPVGRAVEVTGSVVRGGDQPTITAWQVKALPASAPLHAIPATIAALAKPELQYQFVEIRGTVRAAGFDRSGTFSILLDTAEGEAVVRVREFVGAYGTLLDAELAARGVLSTSRDAEGAPGKPKLWVETAASSPSKTGAAARAGSGLVCAIVVRSSAGEPSSASRQAAWIVERGSRRPRPARCHGRLTVAGRIL